MSAAYWTRSIGEQAAAVNDGTVSAQELVTGVRSEIDRRESDLAAWVTLSETYLHDAHAAGAGPLPLRGVSVGVKDLIDVAGLPTRAGSTVTSPSPAPADSPCVARLRELGAIVQGKTVTTEFGYFAPGPTRNPHDPTHTPGGSSSGSAAAVGAGTIPLALGTQTAGSLSRPASYCGTAGFVFAHGATDTAGIAGLSDNLDSLGILTRTVDDLRYVYAAFTGVPSTPKPAARALIWPGSGLCDIEPSMAALLCALPAVLADAGAVADDLNWDDHIRTLAADHATVMAHDAARTLGAIYDAHAAELSAPLRTLVESGRSVSGEDSAGARYRRDLSRALLEDKLGDDTIIAGPAAPGPAPLGLSATGSPILSRPWQLLGFPVVVVPGAYGTGGLPIGIQLIGPPGTEMTLLELGSRIESVLRILPRQSA